MNQNQNPQIQSLVRSLLKVIGSILVTHGATAYASLVNNEDVCGLITLGVGLILSAYWHAPNPGVGSAEIVSPNLDGGGRQSAATPPPASAWHEDALARSDGAHVATPHPVLGGTPNTTGGTPVPPIPQSAIATPD